MNKFITFLLIIYFSLLFLSVPISYASVAQLENEDFSFEITETAEYTNHRDDSMLITFEGKESNTFSFFDGQSIGDNNWISGVVQIKIDNYVELGNLYDSNFRANSTGKKIAIVESFNMSLLPTSNYSSEIKLNPTEFVADTGENVTLVDGITNMTSVLLRPDFDKFVLEPNQWINEMENYMNNYKDRIDADHDSLNTEITNNDLKLEYSVSGNMLDMHVFTHHNRLQSVVDYNNIIINGGFSLEYSENGALNEYIENYVVHYNDIKIMDYSYEIKPGSKVGGITIGDSEFFPTLLLPIALIIIIAIPIIRNLFFNKK